MRALASGEITSRELTEACLAAIDDPDGEGKRAFLVTHHQAARAAADAADRLRAAGVALSPVAGIPISIKDLFDEQGVVTRAGSPTMADQPPAVADAPAIARLRQAGMVIVGRTNMTEFAYGGIGMNVHFGTPRAPWRRGGKGALDGHVPGGSSSGAAVSVADGMALAGIGSDTGGSTRIPAAFCGLTGWKPTQRRISRAGVVPLSTTLDSIGPIARGVADCAVLDALMAGEGIAALAPPALAALRIGVPTTSVLDGVDGAIAQAFDRALHRLSAAGAHVRYFAMPELAEILGSYQRVTFSGSEAWAWHRTRFAGRGDGYDWRVAKRLTAMRDVSAADYLDLVAFRTRIVRESARRTAEFDLLAMPTVPIPPPRIDDLERDEAAFFRLQPLTVRNCQLVNFLDRCAISLPIAKADVPAGLMLVGETLADQRLLASALAVETITSS
jgi:aspartyl-tRNA(Asn)/glutamyl-tRNA(Gln) amidotransferase subunit A